jgi:hypothetical protein
MGKRHTLKGLRVDEISLVDAPANPGALALLYKRRDQAIMDADVLAYLKRSFSEGERKTLASSGKALPDGSFPIENVSDLHNAIKAVGRASDPAKAKAHIRARAKALNATDAIPDTWKSFDPGPLERLLTRLGIGKRAPDPSDLDPDIYADAAADAVDKATDALAVSIASILADAAVSDKAAAISKSLAEFRTHLGGEVPGQIEKAMRDVAVAAGVIEKDDLPMPTIEELVASVAALTKRLEDTEGELAKAKKKLPPDPDGDAQADADEKKKADKEKADAMKKALEAGQSVELTKALAETADLQKRLAVFEAEREVNTMKRRAIEIGVPETQAELLLKARQGDPTSFDAVLDIIKAANAQARAGGVFKEFGSAGGGVSGAGARGEVEALAQTLVKADPKLSIIAARVAVRKQHPDIAQRERDEERAAIRQVV